MTKSKIIKVGIIGGSGLDDPQILDNYQTRIVRTPYGRTSSQLIEGKVGNCQIIVLARHGKNHQIPPSEIPYRANIWAFKEVGCTHILASSACGSLRADIKPGNLVFPDQFIDWTKLRKLTFYDKKVVHTPMAEAFDRELRNKLIKVANNLGFDYHPNGTVVTIEGPRFSTKAESRMFRMIGADIINMSTVPEVVLANELSIPYQLVAMSTDYDCWKDDEEPVDFEMILKRMKENADKVKELFIKVVENI